MSSVLSRTTLDGYLCADGQSSSSRDYEEHLYVNTQTLDGMDALTQGPNGHKGPDSPQKDIFDMRKSYSRATRFLEILEIQTQLVFVYYQFNQNLL
jgi:hypothetical protein